MEKFTCLLVEQKDKVAVVTLNRPERLNALNAEIREELFRAMNALQKDDSVRAVVLTGAGKGFCSGADVTLQAAKIAGQVAVTSRRTVLEPVGAVIFALHNFEKPLIGAINGAATGAGLSMALACDIKIASSTARFAAIWVKRGLIPDAGATYLMPRLIGLSNSFEMAYTGDIINADRALQMGIVSKIVPPEDLMKVSLELANRIASGPPIPIELIKRAFYRGMLHDMTTMVDYESYGQNLCRNTEDHKEGVRSFMEKREAIFKGM